MKEFTKQDFFFSIIYVIGLNIFINELKKSESLRISQLNLGEINSVSLILNSLDRKIEMGIEMKWNNHFIIIFDRIKSHSIFIFDTIKYYRNRKRKKNQLQ